MVRAASHCAARNPIAPSLGCRGLIRLFGFRLFSCKPWALSVADAAMHQSQLTAGNNAVSRHGICRCLHAGARLATLGENKTSREGTMPAHMRSLAALAAFAAAAAMTATAANAQKKYDPGASDTEIRIGNIMPY